MIKLEHLNLDGFQCVIVYFGALLSGACGDSFYVTLLLHYFIPSLFDFYSSYTFHLISAYLHFSHIFMLQHIYIKSFTKYVSYP